MEEKPRKGFRFLRATPVLFPSFTTLSYNVLPKDAGRPTILGVYDVTGNLVKTLVKGHGNPRYHKVQWDGKDENGIELPSGAYFYRLSIGERVLTAKGLVL